MQFWALLVIDACLAATQKMNNQSIKAIWASIDQRWTPPPSPLIQWCEKWATVVPGASGTVFQKLSLEALLVQVHQKFADIVIWRQLELTSSASTATKMHDTLGGRRGVSSIWAICTFNWHTSCCIRCCARVPRIKWSSRSMIRCCLFTRHNFGQWRSRPAAWYHCQCTTWWFYQNDLRQYGPVGLYDAQLDEVLHLARPCEVSLLHLATV